MVVATFQLTRTGNQNNNWYAFARISGGSAIQNQKVVRTNTTSFMFENQFQLIAFDNASNTSNRTYRLQVAYSATGSAGVRIRNASLMVIEIKQ